MTTDQILVFSILGGAIILFIWDKWRYDLVAMFTLFIAVIVGVVPAKEAFTGFSDPVVITVATILIISAAISRSGFIDWSMKLLSKVTDKPRLQIVTLVGLVMTLSAFMNNVGALAVLLPITLAFARKAERPASQLLMPLSFGSLLGGLVTLIGTPPNILISDIRRQITGEPYHMFDFAPVGLGICAVGILYLMVGWRFIPANRQGQTSPSDRFVIEDYVTELTVPEDSPIIGKRIGEIENGIDGDLSIVGLIRAQQRRLIPSSRHVVKQDDVLIVETDPVVLKNFIDKAKLVLVGSGDLEAESGNPLTSDEIGVTEAIIMTGSELANASPRSLSLRSRYGVNLLAVRQAGKRSIQRMRNTRMQVGDIVVLQGNLDGMANILKELGCLPLAERNLLLGRDKKAILPVLIMGVAVALAAFNVLPISIAFLGGVLAIGLIKILRMHEMYEAIDAPVLILLAALMPITAALQTTGGTELVSTWIAGITQGLSGYTVLTIILAASMLITPFLNNAATVLLMAPIAAGLAAKLGMKVDPFLMAVAIGTSCDFLTPIGHQSNTLVMGPGGYKFSDYWRMGLPLSILVIIIATPLILMVWPLH